MLHLRTESVDGMLFAAYTQMLRPVPNSVMRFDKNE
jgi:hypothetical protein